MTDKSDDEWYSQFVKLNATEEHIASEFSKLIKYILRAIVSQDYYQSNRHEAGRSLKFMLDLIRESEKPILLSNIVDKAVDELSPPEPERGSERYLLQVAEGGVKYIVELSCDDNAARGRQSKQESNLISSIEWYSQYRSSGGRESQD